MATVSTSAGPSPVTPSNQATMTLASAATEPTDRSIPAVRITSSMPRPIPAHPGALPQEIEYVGPAEENIRQRCRKRQHRHEYEHRVVLQHQVNEALPA